MKKRPYNNGSRRTLKDKVLLTLKMEEVASSQE